MLPTKKVIWMIWFQGLNDAPVLIQKCLESWKYFNPDYTINFLDKNSIRKYSNLHDKLDLNRKDITVQVISNLYRLDLLSNHGGVWVDATVFCTKPLDQWLPEYYTNGYFAFRNPGPDRLFSTWFISAERDNIILEKHYEEYLRFFVDTHFWFKIRAGKYYILDKVVGLMGRSIKRTLIWHSLFVKKITRVYPYFICHYTFNKIILNNTECANVWNSSKSFEADYPHILQQFKLVNKDLVKAISDIDNDTSPLYKLNWRNDYNEYYWKSVLDHLTKLIIV